MQKTALKTAVIGVGAWARVLAKAANGSDKIDFVCCVGRNPERISAFAGETGIQARDIDAVLADKEIAGVVLALPNELHFEFAKRAALAGKHIYIEKPIANTMADSLAIAALEKAHGVRIVVGHCARLLAGVRAIKAAMDAGKLGKVSQLEANFSNDRGLRLTSKDWRFYRKARPAARSARSAFTSSTRFGIWAATSRRSAPARRAIRRLAPKSRINGSSRCISPTASWASCYQLGPAPALTAFARPAPTR